MLGTSILAVAIIIVWSVAQLGQLAAAYQLKAAPVTKVAIAVLGYRGKTQIDRAIVNHARVKVALDSAASFPDHLMIASGGGFPSEASYLSTLLLKSGYTDHVQLEEKSSNTWENVREVALQLPSECTTLVIASDPMHAIRARRYFFRLRPESNIKVAVPPYNPFENAVVGSISFYDGLFKLVIDQLRYGKK